MSGTLPYGARATASRPLSGSSHITMPMRCSRSAGCAPHLPFHLAGLLRPERSQKMRESARLAVLPKRKRFAGSLMRSARPHPARHAPDRMLRATSARVVRLVHVCARTAPSAVHKRLVVLRLQLVCLPCEWLCYTAPGYPPRCRRSSSCPLPSAPLILVVYSSRTTTPRSQLGLQCLTPWWRVRMRHTPPCARAVVSGAEWRKCQTCSAS